MFAPHNVVCLEWNYKSSNHLLGGGERETSQFFKTNKLKVSRKQKWAEALQGFNWSTGEGRGFSLLVWLCSDVIQLQEERSCWWLRRRMRRGEEDEELVTLHFAPIKTAEL